MIFVWQPLGFAYFPGLAVAIAGNKEQAIEAIMEKIGNNPYIEEWLQTHEPECYEVNDVHAFVTLGGD